MVDPDPVPDPCFAIILEGQNLHLSIHFFRQSFFSCNQYLFTLNRKSSIDINRRCQNFFEKSGIKGSVKICICMYVCKNIFAGLRGRGAEPIPMVVVFKNSILRLHPMMY